MDIRRQPPDITPPISSPDAHHLTSDASVLPQVGLEELGSDIRAGNSPVDTGITAPTERRTAVERVDGVAAHGGAAAMDEVIRVSTGDTEAAEAQQTPVTVHDDEGELHDKDAQTLEKLEEWARAQGGAVAGGGDIPGPPEPPETPETPSPDDEGRFLSPLPPATSEGVEQLRNEVVETLAATPLSEAEIADRLRTDASLAAAYPGLGVSETFRRDRPNIRFTAPRVDESSLVLVGGEEAANRVMEYAATSGLVLAEITTPESLAEQLVKIRGDLSGRVPDACIASLLDDAFRGYVNNLELQRLTQDPNGRLVRFTSQPMADSPDSFLTPGTLESAQEHFIGFRFIHPSLRPMASVSWLTTWHRQEPRPDIQVADGFETRTRIETTVGRLEQIGHLALDRSTLMSLLAFRTKHS